MTPEEKTNREASLALAMANVVEAQKEIRSLIFKKADMIILIEEKAKEMQELKDLYTHLRDKPDAK